MEKSIDELLAFFQRYGGVADFTGIDDDIRLFWQLPVRYLSDALEPARVSARESDRVLPSCVALVLNGGFNAVIRHESDAAIAGIFIGVPLIAFKACRLLALRLNPASGLPVRDENERLVVYPEKLTLPTSWQPGADPCGQALDDITAFEQATPLDNNELATFMFDIVMRYVAMHECMHFVLGHARFCQIELGMNAFEDGNERRRELGGHTSQAMEFISDRHVIAGLSHDLRQGRLYHEWSRQPPEGIAVETERWYRRILFVTMGLISRLWVLHGSASFGNLSQPYPHPYERLCWMHASLIEIEGEALARDTMEAVGLTMTTLDNNYRTPYRLQPDLQRDTRMLDLTGRSRLNEGYDNIRREALKLQHVLFETYGPFYPAPQDSGGA